MNTKIAAQVIRDSVTMDRILDLYGYRPKHGFLCCPFHGEKEPSLKIYQKDGGWHCFGCGRGGSVIDFVMEHESCSFNAAVDAIDNALGLGLRDPNENPITARQKQRLHQSMDDYVKSVYEYCDVLIRVIRCEQDRDWKHLKDLEEKRKDGRIREITADEWTFLLNWKNKDEFNNYKIEKIEGFKEEVAAWRRKARKS